MQFEAVKYIANKIGHKFKPWEAAKYAKNIGNFAKFLGPVTSVCGFALGIRETVDEADRDRKVVQAQVEFRQVFREKADELEKLR